MAADILTLDQLKQAMAYIAENMIASKEMLTRADQAIGDGDHGIGMARGFDAVRAALVEKQLNQVEDVFFTTGSCLLASIGGASGAIFGSFFLGASRSLKGSDVLDAAGFKQALTSGLEMVKKRGGAHIGDKTMVDALEPAVLAAGSYSGNSLADLSKQVYLAAQEGMQKTKTITARIGKAKTLGERTLGHADPGAISITLIFQFFNQFIEHLA